MVRSGSPICIISSHSFGASPMLRAHSASILLALRDNGLRSADLESQGSISSTRDRTKGTSRRPRRCQRPHIRIGNWGLSLAVHQTPTQAERHRQTWLRASGLRTRLGGWGTDVVPQDNRCDHAPPWADHICTRSCRCIANRVQRFRKSVYALRLILLRK